MKIALFEYTDRILRGVRTVNSQEETKTSTNKVRVSEWVDVEFQECDPYELITAKAHAIDVEIDEKTLVYTKEVSRLEKAKAELHPLLNREVA